MGFSLGPGRIYRGEQFCRQTDLLLAAANTGLHINLSEGVPISNPESIPSLVEGRVFVGKTQLLAAANAHKARERRGGGKEIKDG